MRLKNDIHAPSREDISARLRYDPETGQLHWIKSGGGNKAGAVAGYENRAGYRYVNVLGKARLAHRIIWLLSTGEWPADSIDHVDGNPRNNLLGNLRSVTHQVNMQNRRRATKGSTTGVLGVARNRTGWTAAVRLMGKSYHLGTFRTAQEAHEAYVAKKRAIHEGCTL